MLGRFVLPIHVLQHGRAHVRSPTPATFSNFGIATHFTAAR
jgi:hypothetical protein